MHKHRLATWLTCIVLAGGIASAAAPESLEIALPSGPSVSVDAVLVPGADGSVFSSVGGWVEEIDLRIEPDGTILLNGVVVGTTNVGAVHSIHMDIVETPEGYVASVTVTDDDLELVVASSSGIELLGAQTHASVSGETVISLTAQ